MTDSASRVPRAASIDGISALSMRPNHQRDSSGHDSCLSPPPLLSLPLTVSKREHCGLPASRLDASNSPRSTCFCLLGAGTKEVSPPRQPPPSLTSDSYSDVCPGETGGVGSGPGSRKHSSLGSWVCPLLSGEDTRLCKPWQASTEQLFAHDLHGEMSRYKQTCKFGSKYQCVLSRTGIF